MKLLITYDIGQDEGGKTRLRHIAKTLENYGSRVQYSVFECDIEPAQWVSLKAALLKQYNANFDSLRFYQLGSNWKHKIEHHGIKTIPDFQTDALVL